MDISDALQRLPDARLNGDKWRAACPAHGGEDRNMEIREDDGKAFFTCYSHNCTWQEIEKAMGVERPIANSDTRQIQRIPPMPDAPPMNGTAPVKAKKQKLTEVARYEYTDEKGVYIFHKIRFVDSEGKKTFRQGVGDSWKLTKDTRRVLYNLPAVVASPVVFIVEGEKDVDRLATEGIVATCNFDGASMPEHKRDGKIIRGQKPKWLESYNEFFKGKTVYILPDNDEQGLAHAIHINKQLHKIADAKIVELTIKMGKGADVSDWLDDGHTIDELLEIVTAPPSIDTVRGIPPVISGSDLFNKHFAPFDFVVADIFALGHLFLLGGRPKSGKSWLMLQMAAAVDQKRPFIGKATRPSKILYIALEDGERRINQRMKILKWRPSKNIDFMFEIRPLSTGGSEHPGLDQLEKLMPFYDLIVIDTLIATLNGKTNENDNVQMGNVMNGLATMAHDTNTAIALVHHTGKTKQDDPFDSFRGASSIRGAYDIGAILMREVGEGEAIIHLESRDFDIEDMTLRQNKDGAGWESLGGKNVMKDIKAGRRVVEFMNEWGGGFTARQFSDETDIAYQTANTMLKTAVKNGLCKCHPVRPEHGGRAVMTYFEEDGDIPI